METDQQKRKAKATKRMGRSTHGHSHSNNGLHSPTYAAWARLKQRCLNPNDPRYKDYGERGITVCKRWLKFENFLADMGEKPTRKYSIERINNDKGYSPRNCKWATAREQQGNTRTNRWLTANGETMILNDWARKLNVHFTAIIRRLKAGWGEQEALTRPFRMTPGRIRRLRLQSESEVRTSR